jgi:hypothetical protein
MASQMEDFLASEYGRSLVSLETHFSPMMKTSAGSARYINWLSYGQKKINHHLCIIVSYV